MGVEGLSVRLASTQKVLHGCFGYCVHREVGKGL